MSLIVAIKDKDRVLLGADKQVSAGGKKDHTSTKIWEVKELPGALLGGVGSARASQIIQYSQIVDKNAAMRGIDTEFVVCSLVPTIATTLKAGGIVVEPHKDGEFTMMPNAFVFAYKSQAWVIWNDLSVIEISDYFAIGSGSDVANGALFATRDKNPFERIVTCIYAAADSTLFVDNGIDLLATEQRSKDLKLASKALGIDLQTNAKKENRTNSTEETTENLD